METPFSLSPPSPSPRESDRIRASTYSCSLAYANTHSALVDLELVNTTRERDEDIAGGQLMSQSANGDKGVCV